VTLSERFFEALFDTRGTELVIGAETFVGGTIDGKAFVAEGDGVVADYRGTRAPGDF